MKRVLNCLSKLWIGILIALVLLSMVYKLNRSEYILNFAPLKVLSGSMEPKIKVGDIVLVKKVDPSNIKEGDVITYKIKNNIYVTHRVVEVVKNHNSTYFITKGDANNIIDSEQVVAENLVGKVFLRIPKLGYFIDFATTPLGFAFLFIVPCVIFLSREALSYIKSSQSERKKDMEKIN